MPTVSYTCYLQRRESPNARSQGLYRGRKPDTILTMIQVSGLEEIVLKTNEKFTNWPLGDRHQGFLVHFLDYQY